MARISGRRRLLQLLASAEGSPLRRASTSGSVNLGTLASSYSTSAGCAVKRRQATSNSGSIRFSMYLIVIPLTAALGIVEPISQNRLDQQMVRRLRHP